MHWPPTRCTLLDVSCRCIWMTILLWSFCVLHDVHIIDHPSRSYIYSLHILRDTNIWVCFDRVHRDKGSRVSRWYDDQCDIIGSSSLLLNYYIKHLDSHIVYFISAIHYYLKSYQYENYRLSIYYIWNISNTKQEQWSSHDQIWWSTSPKWRSSTRGYWMQSRTIKQLKIKSQN